MAGPAPGASASSPGPRLLRALGRRRAGRLRRARRRTRSSRSTATPTCPGSSRSGWPGRATTASTSTPRPRPRARARADGGASSCWSAAAWAEPRPPGRHLPPLADPLGWVPADSCRGPGRGRDPRLHRDLGNREDRKRARLKYVLEERGVDGFRARGRGPLRPPLAPAPELPEWHDSDDHLGWHRQDDGRWFLGLPVPSGRVAGTLRARARPWSSATSLDVRVTRPPGRAAPGIDAADRADVVRAFRRPRRRPGRRAAPRRAAWPWPARPCPPAGRPWPRPSGSLPEVIDRLEGELAAAAWRSSTCTSG